MRDLRQGDRYGSGPYTVKASVDSLWSVRARLGFLAANNVLVYGTAGYGGMALSVKESLGGFGAKWDGTASGFVGGGGVEVSFSRNIAGRIEGLYYVGKGSGDSAGIEQDVTVVRAGVSCKF